MDANARNQARLILEDISERSGLEFTSRLDAILAEHSAKGCLRSGATIKVSVRMMEELGEKFIQQSVDRVSSVAKDFDAFAMIREAMLSYLSFLEDKVDSIAKVAGGRLSLEGNADSIYRAAQDLFADVRKRLSRQLAIHQFAFTVPFKSPLNEVVAKLAPPNTANKGGKPLAAHWDAMWAAIAVDLYLGDLNPKTQADIEAAMHDWLAAHEFDAAESTVRGRARKLWQAMQQRE